MGTDGVSLLWVSSGCQVGKASPGTPLQAWHSPAREQHHLRESYTFRGRKEGQEQGPWLPKSAEEAQSKQILFPAKPHPAHCRQGPS